jgi:nitrogen-specific signal transduction histidine kinase/CheY-like chemotaxis protein
MLVQALERALQERTALVRGLLAESRVREATVRALESTRTQLTHAQKMELIGQMAGGIAHDMNNALTAILGEASLLGDGAQEERERILEATAYAAKLTQQLMVFSRRDTTRPRPIDLTATMQGVVSALRRVVPSEIALGADLPREPIAVVADPTQILQVMLNLGANARDAMESGGALAIRVLGDAAARQAVIEVRDTGAGIPADVLPRIFEPFFTTKPSGKGTGLGLATVRQLVEAMGGSVEVRSQVGAGTTFTIRLPTTEAAVVEEPGRHVAPGSRSGTVLVVEDDVRVRAVILAALERAGYRMLEATSCEAARALLARRPEGVDLLLTDVVMPGGGAAELIRLVRERFPRTRVLVMSGYNADETLRRGVAQGAYPFIAKPFTADALARAIDAALA